jgi:hypothetical protein
VQTALSITNVTFSASFNPIPPSQGGGSSLSVGFDVLGRGPNHIAGMYVTADSWGNWEEVHARFSNFTSNGEHWTAGVQLPDRIRTFEFVVFCDDLGGVNTVQRIWNTNGGTVFHAATGA